METEVELEKQQKHGCGGVGDGQSVAVGGVGGEENTRGFYP